MATVTKPIALDESLNTTELSSRNVADVLAQELSAVATAIGGISAPSAEDVSYDNSGSGLSATDVQNALDEIVSDIPTVNDGTLTIQQNGETKGTFTANQSGNSTVNIETPTTDIQTAVDEFETYNGGLLSECKVTLEPVQDLHGYENPWVGGAGKNLFNPTALTTTTDGVTFTNNGDGTYTLNGTATADIDFSIESFSSPALGVQYRMVGCPTGLSSNAFLQIRGTSWMDDGNGSTQTSGDTSVHPVQIRVKNGATFNNVVFKPMFSLDTTITYADFEPYENICPISGHTQVEIDVSDGQTTQEQITVNLGGTYYSGTLDVVSGVFTVIGKVIDLGDINWTYDSTNQYFYANALSDIYQINQYANPIVLCEGYKPSIYQQVNTNNGTIGTSATYVKLKNTDYTVPSALKTSLAGIHLYYPLATPTTIQLSPTMVKALVGENHLSAPLEGQEITESKYKQAFTFDDVIAYIQSLS